MAADNLIVREYLESLKEDGELDKIFPLLLNLMGFRVISTPKSSKGQPQYGKDIIATGKDADGVKKRYYFELKGHSDKDINDEVFLKPDGIRESLLAAKDTDFSDSSIPGFNDLPIKIVLVHNGILKANTRPTFEGFIKREFSKDNFERWGIEELTEFFGQFLFGEYLLTDAVNIRLLKKTLVLLEVPDYDLRDFKQLIKNLLSAEVAGKKRALAKLFSTLNLLAYLIYHYSKENKNLQPAKAGIAFIILESWAWILGNKLEKKQPIIKEFRKLLSVQYTTLKEYFSKVLPATYIEDGLFAENGGPYEHVGYPLRAMTFISELIYFFHLRQYFPLFNGLIPASKKRRLEYFQKKALFTIIEKNDGCSRPLIDGHAMPILMAVLFVLRSEELTDDDKIQIGNYVIAVFNNIGLIKTERDRLPELYNNIPALIQFVATGKRPFDYTDSSSMLITILFELLVIFEKREDYALAREVYNGNVNLQTAYPNLDDPSLNIEELMFAGNIYDYMWVQSSIHLPEKMDEFESFLKDMPIQELDFRTKKAGFPFLVLLAIQFYQNDIFPQEWRAFLQ